MKILHGHDVPRCFKTGQFERRSLICGCLDVYLTIYWHCKWYSVYYILPLTLLYLGHDLQILQLKMDRPDGPWLPCPSSTQHRLQIHMLKKIQCRWPLLWLFKTSASEGVSRLMEGRWLRVETHFQRTHLSWCADFAANDLQNYKCKGQNGQNHQAHRNITLHVFWLTFYCYIYIYINMSRLQNVWKQRLEERLMGPFAFGVFLQHHTWIYIV